MGKSIDLMISIDLGNESVKCGYAYKDSTGSLQQGSLKLSSNGMPHYPTSALYLETESRWIYGYEAENNVNIKTYTNIKDLLCLLNPIVDANGKSQSVSSYYNKHKKYFKFYFPKLSASVGTLRTADGKYTFTANQTPKEVCEAYFVNMFDTFIIPSILHLANKNKLDKYSITFMSIYPAGASEAYIVELERLIKKFCGKPATYSASNVESVKLYDYSLSTTKAIASYIQSQDIMPRKGNVLIVDVSATQTSVARAEISSAGMLIDGADGHSQPTQLGGKDYDDAIQRMVNYKVNSGAVLGGGADADSIAEQGTHLQQYFMLNNIKFAKTYFGDPDCPAEGVCIDSDRDILSMAYINDSQFVRYMSSADQPSNKIVDYIVKELSLSVNDKVDYVVLAGGASCTYGLVDLLEEVLSDTFKNISVLHWHNKDDMLYSAAIGGAIWPTNYYSHKMCAPLSYGSWATEDNEVRHSDGTSRVELMYYFYILIKKGDEFDPAGGSVKKSFHVKVSNDESNVKLQIFSANTTQNIDIGKPASRERRAMHNNRTVCLKTLCDADLSFTLYGRPFAATKFHYYESINYDRDGRATVSVCNDVEKNISAYSKAVVEIVGNNSFEMV